MKGSNTLLALGLMAAVSLAADLSFAQTAAVKPITPIAASAPTAVPALVPYSGAVISGDGKTFAAESGVTFQIYKDEVGGEALWTESQTVAIDSTGHYKAQLGATSPNGLPADLFASGEARWLEVQVVGEAPQPRVLLVSVPYALKAADAATLGGLPPSAFALARPASEAGAALSPAITPNLTSNVTTTGGVAGYLAEFSGVSSIVDSPLFVNGANVGIGTITPVSPLDVNGTVTATGLTMNGNSTFNGIALFPAQGTATATTGYPSQYFKMSTSAYNSSTKAVVTPRFLLQAEPVGNNTASPSATFNLLSSTTSAAPTQTGFYFNANGTINFAPGQTFPGVSTITGVTAGTGLTGGGSTGNVTLNLDTTKVPLLASNNTFTGNQAITGTETVTGNVAVGASVLLPNTSSASVGLVQLGTTPFLSNYGPANGDNAFIGGAGNFKATGGENTGTGFDALNALTSGVANTADGDFSLISETTGTANTGIGYDSVRNTTTGSYNAGLGYGAVFYNTTGSLNTGVGLLAGPASGSTALSNTTAIGANATVSQSNTLVLGNTSSTPGAEFVNVGIGTPTPISSLEMSVSASQALGPVLTLTNPGDTNDESGAAVAIDFNTTPIPTSNYYPSDRIEAIDNGAGSANLEFLTGGCCGLTEAMGIYADGEVHVDSQFTVSGNQQFNVTSLASANNDAVYGAGGDGAFSSSNGGNGGDFYGGTAGGSGGRGGYGIYAYQGFANGGPAGMAGVFQGNVQVNGTLSATVKNFKIDDPLDPANKYLVHSSIESSEMVNIYSGNVVTDELGLATVKLPDWFEAENGDFRYQLTVVGGQFAQAIVSKEIQNHEFTISTNATHVKVSWQVTGVRQDAYAKAHPMVVEEAKDEKERGFYIHPDLFGQPEEKQIEWGRRPEAMQRMKALRDKSVPAQKTAAKPAQLPHSSAPASAVTRNFTHPAAPAVQPHASGAQLKPISQTGNK